MIQREVFSLNINLLPQANTLPQVRSPLIQGR